MIKKINLLKLYKIITILLNQINFQVQWEQNQLFDRYQINNYLKIKYKIKHISKY